MIVDNVSKVHDCWQLFKNAKQSNIIYHDHMMLLFEFYMLVMNRLGQYKKDAEVIMQHFGKPCPVNPDSINETKQ